MVSQKSKFLVTLAAPLGSIFDFLSKLTGYNLPITAARMKKFATTTYHRSDKIRELGFEQKIELQDGFKKMVEWYLESKI